MINFSLTADDLQTIWLSCKVALSASFISLPFALLVAHILVRRRFWGILILDVLVHLPLILPPVVTGVLLLMLFGKKGIIGRWLFEIFEIQLAFRFEGAVIAAAVMAFPLMVRAIRLAYEQLDYKLEEAAATLGASPVRIFTTIMMPVLLPGIIAGFVLGFARSMGEFGATITFASAIPKETKTIPSAIYQIMQIPGGEKQAMPLIIISLILSIGALLISEWLARRFSRYKKEMR